VLRMRDDSARIRFVKVGVGMRAVGMPPIFRQNGYRFFFYPTRGIPASLCIVHCDEGRWQAKIWIDPEISCR